MEVAGLVVGVIPLVVTTLECYEKTLGFAQRIRGKNALFRSLGLALSGYDEAINGNITWLLLSIGVDNEISNPGALLQDPEIVEEARLFLGDAAVKAFQEAIHEVYDALAIILRKIDGFLAVKTPMKAVPLDDYHDKMQVLRSIKFSSQEEVKIRYRESFKLALRTREIEDCIAKADRATKIINNIRSVKSDIEWVESRDQKKAPLKKLAKSLLRVRGYATHLHKAICSTWTKDCHSVHEINICLEDRIGPESQLRRLNHGGEPILFNVVFVSKGSSHDRANIRKSVIEVLSIYDEDDVPELDRRLNRVRIQLPQPATNQNLQPSKVIDICAEVCTTQQAQHVLQLSVRSECTIHYQPSKAVSNIDGAASTETITLQDLLYLSSKAASYLQLSLRGRTELALILASALLQLSKTPWFDAFWTKEGVHFAKPTPSVPNAAIRPRDVDITKPLANRSFSNTSTAIAVPPKKVMLEFAILLLELWNAAPLEERFADRLDQVNGDDLDKKLLAERWIEEDRDHLLGSQFQVITNCLKYLHFYERDKLSWEDDDFLRSFTAGVVEPLYREANQVKSI